jgi:hypothetical protein
MTVWDDYACVIVYGKCMPRTSLFLDKLYTGKKTWEKNYEEYHFFADGTVPLLPFPQQLNSAIVNSVSSQSYSFFFISVADSSFAFIS